MSAFDPSIRLFNAACRNLWERGWRPEVAA